MEIFKYLELNDNENITSQNLWDAVILELRGKFIASSALTRKEKKVKSRKWILRSYKKDEENKGGWIKMGTEIKWKIKIPFKESREPELLLWMEFTA